MIRKCTIHSWIEYTTDECPVCVHVAQEERIAKMEARMTEIKNLCSEAELHRYECECLTCQIFTITGGKK